MSNTIKLIGIAVAIIGIVVKIIYSKTRKQTLGKKKPIELLDIWRKRNLHIRIALHRAFGVFTSVLVCICIMIVEDKGVGGGIKIVLLLAVLMEILITIDNFEFHLEKKALYWPFNMWSDRVTNAITNHSTLKYKRAEYPYIVLLMEIVIIALLCGGSGGLKSPFIFLFTFFTTLALYILYNERFRLSVAYLTGFSVILILTVIIGKESRYLAPSLTIPSFSGGIPNVYMITAALIVVYCLLMTAFVFYTVNKNSIRVAEKRFNLAYEQTKLIVGSVAKKHSEGRVFVIGDNERLSLEKTLALVPYCLGHPDCRHNNNGHECVEDNEFCQIRQLREYQLNNISIKAVAVVDHGHEIDNIVADFKKTSPLSHIIAICCPSNLAKYVPHIRQQHPEVTVVYVPILGGNELCLSSLKPGSDKKWISNKFGTYYEMAALYDYLESLAIEGKMSSVVEV